MEGLALTFKRLGLNLSRQTMANWMIYVSENYLRP